MNDATELARQALWNAHASPEGRPGTLGDLAAADRVRADASTVVRALTEAGLLAAAPDAADREWFVFRRHEPDAPWRGPWTEAAACEWVAEFVADGGNSDAFYVAYREVGPYLRVEEA